MNTQSKSMPIAMDKLSLQHKVREYGYFWALAAIMWLFAQSGALEHVESLTHTLWWIFMGGLIFLMIGQTSTSIDPKSNIFHHLGADIAAVMSVYELARISNIADDTMSLILAPAFIAMAIGNTLAGMGHYLRVKNPEIEEMAREQRAYQAEIARRKEEANRHVRAQAAQRTSAFNEEAPSKKNAGSTHRNAGDYEMTTSRDGYKQATAQRAKISFKDIIGMEDLKKDMLAKGKDILESYEAGQSGARNGIMLVGTPGNGKTMFGEALAGELRLPFIYTSMDTITSRWNGEGTERLVDLFASAAMQSPCVFFIDEIDAVLKNRDDLQPGSSAADDTLNLVNSALAQLTKIRNRGVIVIGATNRFDKMDTAATRDGRFDFKITVPAPDEVARKGLVTRVVNEEFKRLASRMNPKMVVPEVEFEIEAYNYYISRWDGFSAARITNLSKEIAAVVANSGSNYVTDEMFKTALKTIQGDMCTVPDSAVTIDELTMSAEVKKSLTGIVSGMVNAKELSSMGIEVRRGAIFYGPARTGKTQGGMSIAKTAGWNFIATTGTELLTDIKKIRSTFEKASANRPCVLFIDECEMLLAKRIGSNTAAFTNEFLTAMDGAGSNMTDVFVIGATNDRDVLDEAVIGGNRLSLKVKFELANEDQTAAAVADWRSNSRIDIAGNATDSWIVDKIGSVAIGNVVAILSEASRLAGMRYVTDKMENPAAAKAAVTRQDILAAIESLEL